MSMNFFKTSLLLAAMTGLMVAMGGLIGGQTGMVIALVIAAGMNAYTYWNSDKMVLRMHNAQQVDAQTAPEYYNMVALLAERAELPMPAVYIIHEDQPNAFATGRDPEHSAVAATTGLLSRLSREEVAGVMAHELAHIKNRDTLIMTIAATIAGAISMLANILQFKMLFGGNRDNGAVGMVGALVAMIVAPMAAMLVQMAISRTREYKADKVGAQICGNPLWLASALDGIQNAARRIPNEAAEAQPATAHMFIINPLIGRGFDNLFSTHPNTENRIAELRALADAWGADGGGLGTGRGAGGDRPLAGPGGLNPSSSGQAPGAAAGPWSRSPGSGGGQAGQRGPWG